MQRIGRSRGTIHKPLKIVLSWRLSHSETDNIFKTVIINSLHIIETDWRKRGGTYCRWESVLLVRQPKKHFLRNFCKTLWRRIQQEKLLISSSPIVLNIITRYIKRSRKTPSLPKPLKTLLLSLAVSDLGVGFLVQPTYVAVLVMKIKQNADNSAYYTIFDALYVQSCLLSSASFFLVFLR